MNRALIPAATIVSLCESIFGEHMHLKRCHSIAFGAIGVIYGDSLSPTGVGVGLARARDTQPKHGIKQVDRLLSNAGVKMDAVFAGWVPWIIASRKKIAVALDWTEHASDGQSTIALHLVTQHGRATPLLWTTVRSDTLKGRRNSYEDALLLLLYDIVPEDVEVTVIADRGFGDVALYDLLSKLGFHYVIRFRGCIKVETANGDVGEAMNFLLPSGKAKRYDNVHLTGRRKPVPAIVTVWERNMDEAWYLATDVDGDANNVVKLYGRRFTIEESFRDEKDPHFGMGLSQTHIGRPSRRDRLLLLAAIAQVLLTLLGHAGEQIGLDRKLRANTVSKRTHSLFRQGREYIRGAFESATDTLRCSLRKLLRDHPYEVATFAWI
jgi:hypothetical protein